MDFAKLRAEGIDHIEQMAGDVWTDYNTHDPGITLLEAICYALTDIGYRMEFPIQDLLAAPADNKANMYRQFQTPAQALACGPVTVTDYRKLFMDIPQVMNAWLTPHQGTGYVLNCSKSRLERTAPNDSKDRYLPFVINGLYDLQLQLDPAVYAGAGNEVQRRRREEAIFNQARAVFQAHRNLCEDLVNISIVRYQYFSICADIQLAPAADVEEVHASILHRIQRFLMPPVNRYSLSELMEKGVPTEQIFDGPTPRFGFFDEQELELSALPETGRTLRSSDLMGIILQVPGVEAIPKFHLKHTDDPGEKGALWSVDIAPGLVPQLSPNSPMRFYKDVFRYRSDADEVNTRLTVLQQADIDRQQNLERAERDLPIPLGAWRDVGRFSSLANDLPKVYGLGAMGLPPTADQKAGARRLAQARQLRAYLLLFDQILSNHLALLEALPQLLSPAPDRADAAHRRSTYFAVLAGEIRDIRAIFGYLSDAADDDDFQTRLNEMPQRLSALSFSSQTDNVRLDQQRRNRQLDHLLARYAERFDDYVLMMTRVFGGRRQAWEVIDDKDDFLNEYPLLSQQRARAYNAAGLGWNENGEQQPLKLWYDMKDAGTPPALINVAGVVRRVAGLMGIDNYKPRNLARIDYQIYQENDEDDQSEFRWRIVDTDEKKILLSSSTKYHTEEACILEMKAAVERGQYPDGYKDLITKNNKHYFNLVDETGEIIARRIEYFDTREQREDAKQYLIDFLTERYSQEGCFVLEHLLLRPLTATDRFLPVCTQEGCEVCESHDPYSFRVSVVLPGFAPRFTQMDFRALFERTLRAELPAHVLAKICWVGQEQMAEFESAYRTWLEYRSWVLAGNRPDHSNSALNDLLDIMERLYTVYPPGTLHDCEEDKEDRPIVLGRSRLGTQSEADLNPDD